MTNADTHLPESEELVALYALGVLEGEERERLEAHLADCSRCRAELAQRRGEVAMLAELADPEPPSADAREALLARVAAARGRSEGPTTTPAEAAAFTPPVGEAESTPAPIDRGGRASVWGWGLALAALLLLALLGWSLAVQRSLRGDLDHLAERNQALEDQLDRRASEVENLRTRLVSTRAALRVVADAPLAVLAGLNDAPGARGRVYGDPRSGSVLLVVEDLPSAPRGRVYQLWGIVGGQPVSAGVFDTSADGGGYLLAEQAPPGPVDTWAVTVEPAGGVPQPSGAMLLKS